MSDQPPSAPPPATPPPPPGPPPPPPPGPPPGPPPDDAATPVAAVGQLFTKGVEGLSYAKDEVVAGAAVAQTEIVEAVDRLSKLILDAYVETDNDVGPRVAAFKEYEEQLALLGAELNRLRDGCSAAHAAHLQLAQLSSLGTGPSVARSFGKRQEGLAQRSQSMAAQYERFVTTTVNQLEGLSLVVANKYKLYCNKVIEIRRRKAQLQLLVKQKERADLRSLERTLIPTAAGAFDVDTEGTLWKCSSTTKLWWSCYARLDSKRKVLLLSKSQADTPTAATKAVALSKYVLCHELPEHYVKRAAAFELVPVDRDLPVIVLAADGTMASRKWVCALQESIDFITDDEEEAAAAAAPPAGEASAADGGAGPSTPQPPQPKAVAPGTETRERSTGSLEKLMPAPLKPLGVQIDRLVDFSSAKVRAVAAHTTTTEAPPSLSPPTAPSSPPQVDELDRKASSLLADHSHRTEVQLSQLNDEKSLLAEVAAAAFDEFDVTMSAQLRVELLKLAESQLEYHQSMASQMQHVCAELRSVQPPSEAVIVPPTPAAPATPVGASGSADGEVVE